jgi:hypothetical protein
MMLTIQKFRRFSDWPSVCEHQRRPTTTTGKSPTRYKNRAELQDARHEKEEEK